MVLGERLQMAVKVTSGQESTMNLWMEGLNAAVHHFWKTCHIIDGDGGNSSIIKGNLGPSS